MHLLFSLCRGPVSRRLPELRRGARRPPQAPGRRPREAPRIDGARPQTAPV